MKRFLLAAALTLSMVVVTACGGGTPPAAGSDAGAAGDGGAGGEGLLTGFSVISSVEKSTDAGAEDGVAQTNSIATGVLVDGSGVIVKCAIDMVQTKIIFSADGKILTPIDTLVPTKRELGDDYGLHKESSLGKDWDQQIIAFCSYVEGKTLDEVKGISVDETTAPADAELASSVTIKIGDYIKGIEKAVADAKERGAKTGDTLGVGIATNIGKSADAEEGKDGVAQAYSIYTLASFDADKKVTSCVIDGSQSDVNFDQTGKITSDLKAVLKSKDELGEAYGLKEKSGIGKEWNEQAAAYAEYALGKTPSELTGIAVSEKGAPVDAELISSVTISVNDFNACIQKASDMAAL